MEHCYLKKQMIKHPGKLIVSIIVIIFIIVIILWHLWYQAMHSRMDVASKEVFVIKPGATINQIAYQLKNNNIIKNTRVLRWLAWYRGDAKKIQVGEYFIEPNLTIIDFLQKIVNGDVAQYGFTIIEGWSFKHLLSALHDEQKITKTLLNLEHNAIKKQFIYKCKQDDFINNIANLEGIFWPDTYFYTAGTTDLEILHRAYMVMRKKLQQEWDNRDIDLQIKNSYEALILASILEKEAHVATEYYAIAGVYHKRLQCNMKLQADPTVIYALRQEADFKMPIKKSDLKIRSAYNTYKYKGLPPTPIAIPSLQALHATLHPIINDALYFVADGQGGHVFSTTLREHNKAAAEYRKKISSVE